MTLARFTRLALVACATVALLGCPGGTSSDGGRGGGIATGGGNVGGGAAGGGEAIGGGGEAAGGGEGGGTVDAGPIDPFDDGGVFVPGDLCSKAIAVDLTQPLPDGGTGARFVADLATATHQYAGVCAPTATGNDLIYAFTLASPQAVSISATAHDGGSGDVVLALLSEPCIDNLQLECRNQNGALGGELLDHGQLPAGSYSLLVDAVDVTASVAYDVTISVSPPAPPPSNDTCATASALVFSDGGVTATADTSGASNGNPGANTRCARLGRQARDVVYRFTLTEAHDVIVEVASTSGSGLAPVVFLRSVCDSDLASDEAGCDHDAAATGFTRRGLPAGEYFLWVDGAGTTHGAATVSVTLAPPTTPPAGDTCAMTPTLDAGTITVDLRAANHDVELSCAPSARGGDAVFELTLSQPQKVTITGAPDAGDDLVLGLLAAPCVSGAELGCRDTLREGYPETLVRPNLAAGSYFVVAKTASTATAPLTLTATLEPPVAPPTNDSCAQTALLMPNTSVTAELVGATRDATVSCIGTSMPGGDVVYRFDLTQPQKVTLTTTQNDISGDSAIALFAAPCATGAELGCGNAGADGDPDTLVVRNLAAGSYFVVVQSAYDPPTGSVGLSLQLDPPEVPPMNDSCSIATMLVAGTPVVVDLSAANHDRDLRCGAVGGGPDVWFTFTLTTPQFARVVATATDFLDQPVVSVFSGSCATPTELFCNESGPVQGLLQPGTYFVALQSYGATVHDTVSLVLELRAPVMGDDCAMPTMVSFTGNSYSTTVDTGVAGNDSVGSCGQSAGSGGDYVFQVSVPPMRTLVVTAAPAMGSVGDPVLYVRTPMCAATSDLQCSDDPVTSSATETVMVSNSSSGAMTYFVFVDDYDPNAGGPVNVTMTLSP